MHCFHNGKLPRTFDEYFVPVTSVHTHLTRKATQGKYFLHSISSEHGKNQSDTMDLSFGIQLIIHCSDYLLFYSENVIETTLFHSMRKKTQHFRYSFHSFLKHIMQINILPIFSVKYMINAQKINKINSYICVIMQC